MSAVVGVVNVILSPMAFWLAGVLKRFNMYFTTKVGSEDFFRFGARARPGGDNWRLMGGWYAPSYTVTSKVTRLVHSVKFEVNIMGWTIFVLNRFHHRTHSIVIKDLLSSSKTCGTIGHCCAGD
jgi:hypothetical protein